MKPVQQELPLPRWGGARKGAGRKRKSPRKNVPHRKRRKFRRGSLHVTVRMRREVWSLRTHRCFRALKRSFARGCERFGFRLIDFSVQGNHIHMIVEAPDVVALGRAIKGLAVRMARALNKVMSRRGAMSVQGWLGEHPHRVRRCGRDNRASLEIHLPEQPPESRLGTQRVPVSVNLQVTQSEFALRVRSFEQRESLLLVAEGYVNPG